MTQEEIDKLANEYMRYRNSGFSAYTFSFASQFLEWLLRDHCIVSKEKIKSEYKVYTDLYYSTNNATYDARLEELEELFGEELFNEE